MAENKKSFINYCDWESVFSMLSDEEAGKLIKHIYAYVNDKNPVMEDRLLQMAFEPIKLSLKRDLKKYENVKEKRAEAGRIGGIKSGEARKQNIINEANEANASISKQKQANEAVNDNVSDSVSDSVNVNESESVNEELRAPKFDLSESNLYKKPNIPTKQQVLESFIQKGGTKEMAKVFYDRNEGTGWYLRGSPIINFRNLADSFISNWKKNNGDSGIPKKKEVVI